MPCTYAIFFMYEPAKVMVYGSWGPRVPIIYIVAVLYQLVAIT